ncbi:unnamed protein product [Bursaphelenchus xylophilus]|nr:unnamed protein product [Bursaphelenchus xylophilus]CAG9080314.1 unnamed protein product [Bursaphelenchus xylophilus]
MVWPANGMSPWGFEQVSRKRSHPSYIAPLNAEPHFDGQGRRTELPVKRSHIDQAFAPQPPGPFGTIFLTSHGPPLTPQRRCMGPFGDGI